jgi:hypothetical protein
MFVLMHAYGNFCCVSEDPTYLQTLAQHDHHETRWTIHEGGIGEAWVGHAGHGEAWAGISFSYVPLIYIT